MATSASGVSPLSQALQSLGVERPAPAAQMDPKSAFEGLARQTNVPANVLMALDEAEGGGADLDRARRNADFLGKRLAGGAKLDDVVAEMAGDAERGAALMSRSYDIADALYPEQAAPKAAPGIGTDLKDLGKLGVAGAVNMTGGALQALGAVADDAIRAGARDEIEASGGDPAQVQGESIVRSGSRAAADAVRGAGDAVAGSISDRMKQAMEGTRFEGELFSPSTWSAGDDPSIRGVLGHTAQGLGSMIPVAAASAVAGPTGAAVMGGLGAAGEGAQSGRDFVQAARGREGEAGPAAIEAMPAFRALLDQGLSPDEAAAELARGTESEAAAWQAIPGALGGAATGKILSRAEGMLNAGGRAARAAKKGLAGAIEEGAQEAAEGMASQVGIGRATGADVNTQQDSFGNFVLGALSGGVMGAGAGLLGPGQTDSEQSGDAAGDAPLGDGDSGGPDVPLLPAPENGGTIFGQSQTRQEPGSFDRDPSNPNRAAADQSGAGAQFRPAEPPPAAVQPDAAAEAERIFRAQPDTMDLPADAPIPPEIDGEFTEIPPISDTGPDGSGAGAVAAPGVAAPLSGAPGAAATTPIPAPPAGPVERLALGIAAATPPARPAPAARFPDQRPGSAVRFGDMASGQIIDGVFLGETEAGARVRVQGREIDLTPEQFDALRDAAPQIEDARKQAEKAAKDAAKAKPAQEAPAYVEPVSAAQWPEQGAGNTDVRLGNDGPDIGAGTAPGGAPVPQGLQGVQDLAGGRGTAAGTGNDNQQDGVGGVVLADDAGKLGTALTNARASGEVEHVTKNGKTKTGYVLQGVTKAEADKIDAYSFRKNGGFFVNTDRADEWAAKAVGDQVNASTPANPIAQAATEADPAPTDAPAGSEKLGQWGALSQPEMSKPKRRKMGEKGYSREDAVADLHELEGQQSANGMVADARLGERIAKLRDMIQRWDSIEADKAKRAEADDAPPSRVTYDGPVPDGFKKVDSRYFTEKEDMGNETTHQYTVQGTNFGKGFRAFRTAFHKQHGSMATELGHFDTFEDAIAATRADREAYAKAHRNDAVQAKPKASVSATTGLTEAEEARLAALKAKLAGKLRNQVNSGLDPEILGIAVEMTGLYVKGGMRKFGAILRNFMADTGLTASQSQRYLRAAYGDVRDEMDLAGEDVSGMDDAAAVMAEVRAALAEESKPDQEPPAPQKRPLIQYVAKVIGGIDPTGTIAAELNHRGITTRTAPGLFRKGGHMDLDNVPASEHPDLAALVGTDDTGNYLDAGAIVEGIAEEVAGRPQPLGEQAELQERAQAVDNALAHIRDQEADHIIVPRGDDPRGATERKDAIARALDDFLDKYAQDSLTGAERKTIIETLNLDGGEIENAVEDAIMRRPLDEPGTAEGEDADIPFGDVGSDPQPGTAGSAPDGSEAEAFDFGRMPSQEPGTTGQGEVNGPAGGSENAALAGSRGAKGGRRGNGRAPVSVTGPQRPDSALAEGVAGGGEPTGSIESADAGGAGPVGSVVSGNDGRPEGGNEPGRSAGAGGARLARPRRDKPVAPAGRPDYVLTDPERIVGGGPKARFARNRAALEAMQSIESEGRDPTPEELDSIAGYIGWGSFGQELFQGSWERPIYRDGWKAENDWLREHLGEAKWKSAQGSIINAHYTDPPTVMAMWDMVRAMGFNGGRVLEPSMGIGNFFSMMPADLAARSDRTGIELDKQTGAMAKLLFPHANISIKGYQDSATPDDFYDLVIGNWPFASQSPADRRYDRLGPSLHDYFFLKALDQTRPGGLVVGITSAGTMDKKGRATRIELAKKADLVSAYRLPSGAFEGYAGTSVVTDIIILKKRAEPNANAADEAWIGTADYAAPAGTIHVNRYFLENPDNVLGRLDFGSGSTYGRAAMIVHRPADLFERLHAIRTALPSDAFTPISRGNEPRFIQNMTTDRQGSITTGPDGKNLYVVQGERLVNLSDVTSYEVKDAKETESREKQIRSLVDMRRAYGALLDAERLGEDAEAPRKRLKALFDAFRKAFGTIADSFGIKVLGKVNDPFAPALRSLERPDGTPATILTRSTMRGAVALENPTVADAYALNRNQTTTLDMEAVAEAAGVSVEDATDELVEAGAVLRIPGGGVEPKDTYLSGNVRRKLREVEDAISRGETDLTDTAEKLRAVQPAPVPYYEIEARLGAPWVTADYYRQFIADMIGLKSIDAQQVDIRPVGGAWKVTFKDRSLNRRPEARSGYGISGYPFSMLFGAAMGNRPITLKTKDEDGKDVVDEKRSAEANAAATKIRERFQEWVWEDAERTITLETAYNDAMRAIADPQYDGDFLTFPGMALTRGESPFNLRKHQRDAIWRGIYNERGLYAHEVGTGKTYTMAGIAVESRRYGKAKKPLILAHNANSAAVYAEAQEMYPGGRFLFVDNLDKDNIATTMQRIASDDWDAVIMPHSVMPRVGFREETLMALAAEEIAALEQEALDAAEEDGVALDLADMDDADAMKRVRSVTAKNLVKQRNAILERIRKSANRASKEGAIPFEELGIDMILVDEAHEFKKPPIATRMQIKGLNTQASDRSIALKLMSDYVKSRRGGTGIHLFTGTPITNALNEIFNMMNYVMDAEMEREGVKSWDMWFNTFADSSTDVEVQSTGEFEAITRLAQFVNVSELRRMAGQVLDIVFASDMPEFKPRETKSGKTLNDPTLTDAERDELLNGRTENAIGRPYKLVRTDVGQMSPAQQSVMDQVVQWSRNWKQAGKKLRREYMLSGSEESPIIHEGIAAKASLDVRSYDARLPDHPDNKVSRATRNIMHHYRESKDGAQVVFVETGYNEKAKPGHGAPFSLVKDLIGKLVAAGIPETQIAVVAGGVKAEKKKAIADAVNAGKIRVVIGQTGTLGVGVNMQKRLRAMHHLDAPWMPGDLEQRNGRGERQGNTWNTVIEYRYLTEGIDGRRWQVLAIKDRFIKAFLRADDSVRVIEGDAVDTSEGDEGGIAATLSEATGDPRLLQRAKLQKDVERLEVRERQHTIGIAQAMKAARKEREEASSREALMADYRRNAELATAARDSGKFTAEIGGTTFTERKDAAEAFKEAVDKLAQGSRDAIVAKVQGFEVRATKRFIDGIAPELWVKGSGKVNYEMGKPTLASAEAAIRNMIGLADHVARTVKEAREAAERLEAQAKRPFAQAERLAARRKLLADIEADMEANPAAPPAWLRHGAPVGTDVFVEGKPREVQGHRWTDEGYFVVTEEGLVPYLEAKAENGTSIYDEHEFESPVKDSAAKVDAQRQAGEKESRFRRSEDMTPADARAVNEAARAELEKVGLAGRVSVEATAEGRAGVTGSYLGGVIRIIRPGGNWKHTLDHEIIHALRDPSLWGARYGMFTAEEWHALVKAARADKGIRDRVTAAYGDLDTPAQSEEMVAELYADWAKARRETTPPGPLRSAFEKVRSFFRAVASALRGEGFVDAASIMEGIANGETLSKPPSGPAGPGGGRRQMVTAEQRESAKEQRDMGALKDALSSGVGRARGMIGDLHWKNAPGFFSSLLTDAMGKNDKFNVLSLVPGRALFDELGRGLPAAQKYLREKEEMDAWRNDWQARAAKVVDGWTATARKDPQANDGLMDLMHSSTLAGVDPSREGSWKRAVDDEARRALAGGWLSPERQEWADGVIRAANDRERMWHRLKAQYDALPSDFRDLFQKVRDEYAAMSDEQDAALMQNIRTASRIALKRADRELRKEMQRIKDEGLTGITRDEAIDKATQRNADAHARAARGGGARIQQLRQVFESNRVAGPYFPLARFGNYFVTIRDDKGAVISFSRFQTEREQRKWMEQAKERALGEIEHGVLGGDANLKGKVDPKFVAEVESLLADAGASGEMMDAVWQRWLETLPDQSVRTSRIHRKGRDGFNQDAIRAFSSAMFHGAHQTARLRHGLEMEDMLDDAEEQAKKQPDPNRAGFVVREMRQRHAFTMQPTNNAIVSWASGLAFTWYLAASPAAALVNLSQTTIVGVPLMAARFKGAGVTGVSRELGRALADFGKGKGWAQESGRLSQDERAAMKAGYDRGVIEKTQSHDLAPVAESGFEYNPTREKVMRVLSWGFHHTERLNREVTYLAAYRLARSEGAGHMQAVDEASKQVWKVHFDYQNTSRPRVMQSDMGKILTTFRNFTVNMLYRLFRDAHQSFAGADAETRREARAQLIGISLSMFAHAGIKGVWGFGLLSMLLGAFLPGDDDDFENWLQDALLVEGDGAGVATWNWTMGMVLNGAPGTVLDTDLTGRIGMPDLWFRGSQKDLEGKDLWSYYVEQVAGPVAGIGGSVATGLSMIADGEWQRGAEKVVPKFAANLVKSARYVEDGVTTYNGDSIIDSVNPYEALTTAMGFTPARVAERYRANTWLKNQEAKITSQRKSLMSDIGKSIKAGNGVTPELAQQVKAWNIKYPFYPITASGLRQSMASRQRLSNRSEGGVTLNPRLDQYLRTEVAPAYR